MKAIVFVLLIVLIACAMLSACGEENEPPKVVDISPKPNSDVPSNIIVLDVEFNVPVSLDSAIAGISLGGVKGTATETTDNRVIWKPSTVIPEGQQVLVVENIFSKDGIPMEVKFTATYNIITPVDITPPKIVSSEPPDGWITRSHPRQPLFIVHFSEPIAKDKVKADVFVRKIDGDERSPVPVSKQWESNDTTLKIDTLGAALFACNTEFILELRDFLDIKGNKTEDKKISYRYLCKP